MEFCSVLTILFIGLKLCGVVAWSWWLVLAPALVELAIALLVMGFLFIKAARTM